MCTRANSTGTSVAKSAAPVFDTEELAPVNCDHGGRNKVLRNSTSTEPNPREDNLQSHHGSDGEDIVNRSAASAGGQLDGPAGLGDATDEASVSSDDHRRIRSATLLDFQCASSPAFVWGEEVNGETFVSAVKDAYQEVVRWRPNLFSIPLGAVGKKFIMEATRLVRAFAEGSTLESVAIWALTIVQQPSSSSSHRQRTDCLQRRLVAWQSGNIQDLLLEGRVLQNDLIRRTRRKRSPAEEEASVSPSFSRLMAQGKVKATLRLLSSQSKGKVLNPHDVAPGVESAEAQPKTVLDTLKEKHPEASAISWDEVLDSDPPPSHSVVFERLTGDTIRHAALHCQGAAGPSGLDANCWRRLCTMFHGASKQLCEALAAATRRLCTSFIDPTIIRPRPFIACRLIPLSKNPGVRPIGICDTLRRIMGKAILNVIGAEIKAVAGSSQ